jgi:hypothetical protein
LRRRMLLEADVAVPLKGRDEEEAHGH